ncbi:MAG: APC family permease [Actinobacteria bacterium]|nr:APC family permease [Actinomycetota bacterium]
MSDEVNEPGMHHATAEGEVPTEMRTADQSLKAGSVGVIGVVFLVVTGAAPIAAMLFNGPLTVLGAGWAAPASFILTLIGLVVFTVGYVQMARRVNAAGGFYTFISHGLGKVLGLASACTVMFAYVMFACQQQGVSGYWLSTTFDNWFGVSIPGWLLVFVAIAITVGISYFEVKITARILGVALCAEVIMLTILGIVILLKGGANGISLEPLNPVKVFDGNANSATAVFGSAAAGIALFGAYFSWTGFEMAPNYAEESRHPARTVGPATYGSVIGVGILYIFVMWMFVEGWGTEHVSHAVALQLGAVPGHALPNEYGSAFYPVTDRYVGHWMTIIYEGLIITSSFAAGIAFYSTASRYVFSMAREDILPSFLGKTREGAQNPWRASLAVGCVMVVYCTLFILSDSSTLAQLTKTSTYGALMGVFALLAIQGVCCIAIIWFFWKHATDGFHWWKTVIAPILGCAAMIFGCQQMLANLGALAGGEPLFVKLIPWVSLAIFSFGFVLALYWRSQKKDRYEAIGRFVDINVEGELPAGRAGDEPAVASAG